MVHQVQLFIDGIHFGLAIKCKDGWYKFEYAASGASGVSGGSHSGGSSGKTSNKVTVKKSPPTGKVYYLGDTNRGLDQIIDYAREGCGFHGSSYGFVDNNCRQFCHALAQYMGVSKRYEQLTQAYFFNK